MANELRVGLRAAALLFAAAGAARADDRVVYDQWLANFEAARKVGWSHVRLTEHPDAEAGAARFTLALEAWNPVGDQAVHARSRLEVDARGRVLEKKLRRETPWGEIRVRVEPSDEEGANADYWVQVRDNAPRSGSLDQPAWSPEVLGLLVSRGELPPGKRTVHTLDLPGDVTEEETFEVVREDGQWRIEGKSSTVWRDDTWRIVRRVSKEVPGGESRPTDEERAPDLEDLAGLEPPEDPLGMGLDWIGGGGVSIQRPDATWSFQHREEPGQEMWLVGHPSGAGVVVLKVPVQLPGPEAARRQMGDRLREHMNARPGALTLGPAEPTLWRGSAALQFVVSGESDMEPVAGRMHMVSVEPGSSYMVFAAYPADLREVARPLVERALRALTIERAKAAPWTKVELSNGITLKVPPGWNRTPPVGDRFVAPTGGSQLRVSLLVVDPEFDMAAAQEQWVEGQRQNPRMRDVRIEVQDRVRLDGRTFDRLIYTGTLVDAEGNELSQLRAGSYAHVGRDGELVELVVIAFSFDWELTAIEKVAEGFRFGPS